MREEDKQKECKGCTIRIEKCIVFRYGNVKKCPCSSCLVKVVCVEACVKFDDFIGKEYTECNKKGKI